MKAWPLLALSWCLLGLAFADEPKSTSTLTIVDGAGKEHKLAGWKFVVGTRPLGWLAKAAVDPKEKLAPGPDALAFREEQSTTFVDGVLTLVPLDRLRSIDYDYDTQTVSVKVATDQADADVVLTGTSKYKGTNKLALEAEADRGEKGVAAVKYLAGSTGGIKSVRFGAPRGLAAPTGRGAAVTVVDKKQKNVQPAVDLQALYRLASGSERLLPYLVFKKTYKVELGAIQKVTAAPGAKPDEPEWTIMGKDADGQTLTLLKTTMIDDQPATLLGLVGRVPAGFKLFPAHVISEIEFDAK
jgi:hypothetical protein